MRGRGGNFIKFLRDLLVHPTYPAPRRNRVRCWTWPRSTGCRHVTVINCTSYYTHAVQTNMDVLTYVAYHGYLGSRSRRRLSAIAECRFTADSAMYIYTRIIYVLYYMYHVICSGPCTVHVDLLYIFPGVTLKI